MNFDDDDDRVLRKLDAMDDRSRQFETQVTRDLAVLCKGFDDMTRRMEHVELLEARVATLEQAQARRDGEAGRDAKGQKLVAAGAGAGAGGTIMYLIEHLMGWIRG